MELAVGQPAGVGEDELRRQAARCGDIDARRIEPDRHGDRRAARPRFGSTAADGHLNPLIPDEPAIRDGVLLRQHQPLNPPVRDGHVGANRRPATLVDPRMAPGRQVFRRSAIEQRDQIRPRRIAERVRLEIFTEAVSKRIVAHDASSWRITIGAFW